jgi:hypothetical protein
MSRTRRTAIAAAAAALALPLLATPAHAAPEPTLVNLLGCQLFDDSMTTVDAGSDVTLRLPGWAGGNYGTVRAMVGSATAVLSLDPSSGTSTALDVTGTISITRVSPTFVIARPDNVHLGTLSAGESVDLLYTLDFSHPFALVYPPVGPSGDNGPYLVHGEDPVTCRITAV